MVGVQDGFLISLPTRKAKYPVMSQPSTFLLEYMLGSKNLKRKFILLKGTQGNSREKFAKV